MKKLHVNIANENLDSARMPEIRIFDHKLKEIRRQKAWSIEEDLKPGLYKISAKIPGKKDIEKVIAVKDTNQTLELAPKKTKTPPKRYKYKKSIREKQFKILDSERAEGEQTGPSSFKFTSLSLDEIEWKTPWVRIAYRNANYLLSLPLDPRGETQCTVNFYSAPNRRYPQCHTELDGPVVSKILKLLRTKNTGAASKLALKNVMPFLDDDASSIADLVCLLALYKSGDLNDSFNLNTLKKAAEKYAYIPDVRVFQFYLKVEQGSLTKRELNAFLELTEDRMLFTEAYSAMIGMLRQMHDGPTQGEGYLSRVTRNIAPIAKLRNTISQADRERVAKRLKELARFTVNVDWSEPFLVIFNKDK